MMMRDQTPLARLGSDGVPDLGLVTEKFRALDDQVSQLYELLPFGSHSIGDDGCYEQINAFELNWLGATREEVIGKKKLTDFLDPPSRQKFEHKFSAHGKFGFADLELDLLASNGKKLPISVSFNGLCSANGAPHKNRFSVFDLSAQQHRREKQRIAAIAFESLSSICVTDNEGKILQVNEAFSTITGYSAQEANNQTMRMVNSGRHDVDFFTAMWRSINDCGSWQGEIYNRRKNGQVFTAWLNISAVHTKAGDVSNYVGIFYDITASKATQEEISRLAYFDALTLLPNRRLLQERLNHALAMATRSNHHGAILFVDLDHFKMINDTRGHQSGDLLLIEVTQRLQNSLRAGDTIARLGGDEFVVLLEEMDPAPLKSAENARQVGEKLLAALAEPFTLMDYEFRCTASIGISLFSKSETAAELLQHADLAMYQAKKAGRNRLCFFDPEMQEAVSARVALEQDLRRALGNQELVLHFQPQVDQHLQVMGAEALLHWMHPVNGVISPVEFIPIAEETGLILPIGLWVLENACAQLKLWENSALTRQLQVAVNVSAHQFRQDDFVAMVVRIVRQAQIKPELLKLEVTEGTVLDVEDAIAKMSALQEIGVQFSMDDFGTGHSSLSNLTKLPIVELKIDRSFVAHMGLTQTDAVIVQTILAMAASLGLQVIAEGVETTAQHELLASYGCTQFQGFLFGRAEPADMFHAWLAGKARPARQTRRPRSRPT